MEDVDTMIESLIPHGETNAVSLGNAIVTILNVLEGLSGRDRLKALRAVSGSFGHRVLPGLGTWTAPVTGGVKVDQRPKAPEQPRSTKSAKQKDIDRQIKELNSQIKSKAASQGSRLKENDPLLARRQHLFRVKHGREANAISPLSGESVVHP